MKIIKLGKDSINRKAAKFVGFFVSAEMHKDLTLLSIAEGSSKSVILRNQLMDKLDSLNLVDKVAERLYQLYKLENQPWSILSSKMFFVYSRNELTRRGVSHFTLQEIAKKFDLLVKSKK